MRRIDLANQLGVSEETIRLWEKGAVQPSAERLARLIALLSLEASKWTTPAAPELDLPPLARRLRDERDARGITQAAVGQDPRSAAGDLRRMGDRTIDAGSPLLRQPGHVPGDRRVRRGHAVCNSVRRRHLRLAPVRPVRGRTAPGAAAQPSRSGRSPRRLAEHGGVLGARLPHPGLDPARRAGEGVVGRHRLAGRRAPAPRAHGRRSAS